MPNKSRETNTQVTKGDDVAWMCVDSTPIPASARPWFPLSGVRRDLRGRRAPKDPRRSRHPGNRMQWSQHIRDFHGDDYQDTEFSGSTAIPRSDPLFRPLVQSEDPLQTFKNFAMNPKRLSTVATLCTREDRKKEEVQGGQMEGWRGFQMQTSQIRHHQVLATISCRDLLFCSKLHVYIISLFGKGKEIFGVIVHVFNTLRREVFTTSRASFRPQAAVSQHLPQAQPQHLGSDLYAVVCKCG